MIKSKMQQTRFKDIPVLGYFTYGYIHYQKISKSKVMDIITLVEILIKHNPIVTYWGQDINNLLKGVSNGS